MLYRTFVPLLLAAAPGFAGNWNKQAAADYLDARQKAWVAWPVANGNGVPCVSCHTGVPYLLARPALRQALGETGRTQYETALLDSLRSRLDKRTPAALFPKSKEGFAGQATGVESIFAALLLAADSPAGRLSAEAEKAFDRMWSLQLRDGDTRGAWRWFSLDLDPWEMPESAYYGAAMAALATGIAPAGYRDRPDVRDNVALLKQYLCEKKTGQPLHNRIMLLWASTSLPDLLTAAERKALAKEVLDKQQPDGGWTVESLGAFKKHDAAPPAAGSNAYATAFTAFVLRRTRISDKRVTRSLEWLRTRQNRETGYWDAMSMNKRFEPGSMQIAFMRDAATSFAVMALLEN